MLDPSLHAPRLLTPIAIGISLGLLSVLEADVTSVFVDEVSLPTIGSITGGLTGHGDAYFFGSDDEDTSGLWRTDGSALGTVRERLSPLVTGDALAWLEERTEALP